jgi:integrase
MLLSARQVATAKGPARLYDGGNLILQVTPSGAKSWMFRYRREGKSRDLGLGSAGVVTLAKARELARECREWLADGKDPQRERQQRRRPSTVPTFAAFIETFIEQRGGAWRNSKTAESFRQSLALHANAIIGKLHLDEITVADVEEVLRPIWHKTPVMADRVRAHIESVLDAALARQHRKTDNPARWKTIQNLFARPAKVRKPEPHAALPYSEIPKLMAELKERSSTSASALRFTILTACRTQEVIGATWSEFDLKAKVWTIPAARMKSEREHRVPLSFAALDILDSLPREDDNPFVFIGGRRGKGLSNIAMLKLMRTLRPGTTVHGTARSAFRDWCSEQTDAPREVAEAALAHRLGSTAEQSYARSDLLVRRKMLMTEWATYCS